MAGSTYTFTQKIEQVEPGQEDNFGGVCVDANHISMSYAAGMQTTDISTVPIVSPVAVTTGAVTTLTNPLNAVQITLATNQDLRLSELSTMATYYIIPGGTTITVDIARVATLYVKADSSNANVKFYYAVV